MRGSKWIAVTAIVALFVLAFTGAALASNPNAACDQTPYGNPGNGANHGGAYDDTCDGSASGNGNGDGNANGKPCAGCVGNADEKNPPGQDPDGTDDNNGYECDGNSGIAKENPAHTGCDVSTTEEPPGEEENPPGTEVLGRKFTKALATTGSPLAATAAMGILLLVGGTVLRVRARTDA